MTYNVALETVVAIGDSFGNAVSVAHTVLEFNTRDDADQYILHYDRNERANDVCITRTATRLY